MIFDSVRSPRSSRVVIDIPVRVHLDRERTGAGGELTKTVLVNAKGALIILAAGVVGGQRLRIVNVRTNAEITCTVANVRKNPKDQENSEVGVAFDEPMPRFWGLSFPPDNWQSADRKRREPTSMPA